MILFVLMYIYTILHCLMVYMIYVIYVFHICLYLFMYIYIYMHTQNRFYIFIYTWLGFFPLTVYVSLHLIDTAASSVCQESSLQVLEAALKEAKSSEDLQLGRPPPGFRFNAWMVDHINQQLLQTRSQLMIWFIVYYNWKVTALHDPSPTSPIPDDLSPTLIP